MNAGPSPDCPVSGCVTPKKRWAIMCPDHWAMLTNSIRKSLNQTYRAARIGGEGAWRVYLDTRSEAIQFANQQEDRRRQRFLASDTGLSGEGAAL